MCAMFDKLLKKKKRRKKKSSAAPKKLKTTAAGGGENTAPRHAAGKVSPRASRGGEAPARAPAKSQRNAVYGRTSSRREPGAIRRTLKSRGFWLFVLRLGMAGVIIGGLAIMYFARSLPDIRELNTIHKQQGITIATEDGRVVANYGDVYGQYIPYEKLPKHLIEAVIATEDRRFFMHNGIDVMGIARAMVVNTTKGRVVQGGSTITQQVAKNVFLTPKRTFERKIQEVLLAFWLEGRFSKKEILAIYLNRVYLGSGAYGIDAAAKRYFNKSGTELNLAESALMAGLLKAPSRYSPAADPERAEKRIHQVLLNMVDAGYLKESAIEPALKSFRESPAREADGGDVRYYTDWIMDEIPNYVGGVADDLVVTTSFDPKLQAFAVDALQNAISMEGEKKHISQAALVSMTPEGAVKAIVGGVSYGKSQYNRATQAKRQPGSIFKLFVYLAALEAGYTPESLVLDSPVSMMVGNKVWTPGNYTGQYKGEIPMVQALRESLNTVAVRLSQYTGVGRVAEMAMRLGLQRIPSHPSIALGSVEATLMEMTGAFAHMANNGKKVVPYGILEIKTREGKELFKREEQTASQTLAEGTVEMMNYMLLDAVRRGTGTRAALPGRPVAGKTGTSQDFKDAWFVGFVPQMVTGVWVGNDDNRKMLKVTGGSVPASIWHDYMTHAMQGKEVKGIPNSPSNGSGLLPWLFGGSSNSLEGVPQSAQPVEEGAPFGNYAPSGTSQNFPAGVQPEQAPAPVVTRGAPAMRQQPSQQPASNDDVLTPGFWNKLMKDNAPTLPKEMPKFDGKVEYTYPGTQH
jgi:penicillin-binding protein 1A